MTGTPYLTYATAAIFPAILYFARYLLLGPPKAKKNLEGRCPEVRSLSL